jgi:hypothetical protein
MKFYLLSPATVPMNQILFPSFIKPFTDKGHSFTESISECVCVLLDLHSRIANYRQDDIDYVLQSNTPLAVFCEWDRGNMSTDEYPEPLTAQQKQIFNKIHNGEIRSIHFCRLIDKNKKYNYNISPYEKPIIYEEPLCTPDELFNREYDLCFIANTAPGRERIAQALREDGRLKCYISLGATKIPFDEFVNQHRKAKLFVSSGAGGYSNERPQSLFSISTLLQERTEQLLLHDFTHLQNCLKIDSPPTKKDLDIVYETVNDKDRLHEIYKNGYGYMKTYWTAEYIANNILEIIEKNLCK